MKQFTQGEGFSGRYADPDPFQSVWDDPAKLQEALYVGHDLMVRLDDHPVAWGHVNVIARENTPLEELTADRYLAMWALARVTQSWLTEQVRPARKVAIAVWGNQVRTAHIHLVPREQPSDATNWQPIDFGTPEAYDQYMTEARQLLTFPPTVLQRAYNAVHFVSESMGGAQAPDIFGLAEQTQRGPGQITQ